MTIGIDHCAKERTAETLLRAKDYSATLINDAHPVLAEVVARGAIRHEDICFAVVGSVGRKEALEASDFDVVPIARDGATLSRYLPHDQDLRAALRHRLERKVSAGQDLTKATSIEELIDPESIGGERDSSGLLTKRVLLLTESAETGGGLPLRTVRERILDAYANQERTSGRHILALCNDIVRYYKTLCIEYKAKVDEQNDKWCTRNIKLRHSRKMWFFSTIMAVVTLSAQHPKGKEAFIGALLDLFEKSPVARLADALGGRSPLAVGRLLDSYAMFLDFMAVEENRSSLSQVEHAKRYEMIPGNVFPSMKFNSDRMHHEMLAIIEDLGPDLRGRVLSWFLL